MTFGKSFIRKCADALGLIVATVAGLALEYRAVGDMMVEVPSGKFYFEHALGSLLLTYPAARLTEWPNLLRGALAHGSLFLISLSCPGLGPLFGLCLGWAIKRLGMLRPPETRYVSQGELFEENADDFYQYGATTHSIVDILHASDKMARRRAVLALRHFEPSLTLPVLRRAVQDSDEEVRIYAQNQLQAIIENFESRISNIKEEIHKDPRNGELYRELAEQYQEQVYIGLAEDDVSRDILHELAAKALSQARRFDHENPSLDFQMLKLSLQRGDLDEAMNAMASLAARGPSFKNNLYPWRCEMRFQEQRYDALLALWKDLPENQKGNKRLLALRDFWLGGRQWKEG